jgi:hypothetical protein
MKQINFTNSDLDFDKLWSKMVEEYKYWDKKCFGELSATSADQNDGIIAVQNVKQEFDTKHF